MNQRNLIACGTRVLSCALFLAAFRSWCAPQLLPMAPPGKMILGETTELTLHIQWEGEREAFAVLAARMDSVPWAKVETAQMIAESVGSTQDVLQTIRITPLKSGTYMFPSVRIAYASKEQLATAEPGTTGRDTGLSELATEPFPVTVREPYSRQIFWLVGAPGVVTILLAAIFLFRRRQRPETAAPSSPVERAQDTLHQARRRRLDGDLYGYYQSLAEAAETIAREPDMVALAAALRERARQVGYQGVRPTDDQLDGDLRDVERALRRSKEATEQ